MFAANASLRYITPPPKDDEKVDANSTAAKMQSRADGKENIPDDLTTHPSHLPPSHFPSPPTCDYNDYAPEASPGWTTGWAAGEAVPFTANGNSQYNHNYNYIGGQQYGHASETLSSWPLWQQQQQLPAFAPACSAVPRPAYDGGYYSHQNLYAPNYCQPTPFGYSYLTADSMIAPATSQLDANAQVFVPPQQMKSVEFNTPVKLQRVNKSFRDISRSPPSSTLRREKPKRLPGDQRRQRAAAKIAQQNDFSTAEHLDRLERLSAAVDRKNLVQERAAPLYRPGAQPSIEAEPSANLAPSKLHQSTLPASFQPGRKSKKGKSETDRAAIVHQKDQRFINAPRVHMMARPMPSSLYTQLALQAPRLGPAPRPLLIILDLNGTLLKRTKYSGRHIFTPRPYVQEFLTYLLANHKVMIWSSARPENVVTMCSDLFTPEQYKQLIAVWGRDRLGLSPEAYNAKIQVYKQLSWVWNDTTIQAANPNKEYMWTQANTVLLDDSINKAASEPHNLIEVEEFSGSEEQLNSDDCLRAVIGYIRDLSYQADVSTYIRSRPFRHERGVEFISTKTEQGSKTFQGQNYIRFDD